MVEQAVSRFAVPPPHHVRQSPPSAVVPTTVRRKFVRFQLPPESPTWRNPHRQTRDKKICSAISPTFLLGGVLCCIHDDLSGCLFIWSPQEPSIYLLFLQLIYIYIHPPYWFISWSDTKIYLQYLILLLIKLSLKDIKLEFKTEFLPAIKMREKACRLKREIKTWD